MTDSILGWMLGGWEVVIIIVAILLLFGGKKLPELARGVGKGLRIFKKEVQGVKDELDEAINVEPDDEEDDTDKKTTDKGKDKDKDKS